MPVLYLIDTNLLLRSSQPTHPMHADATRALTTLKNNGEMLHIVPQNLFEFWVVCTRPAGQNGLGMTPARAQTELSQVKALFTLLLDPPALYADWERLVTVHRVMGKEAHDARLVAAMKVHGLTHLLTFNTGDFARYIGESLVAVDPATV